MTIEEWDSIARTLEKGLFWITISGGEPFLYKDLTRLARLLHDRCHPRIINLPTNGLLVDRIPGIVEEISASCGRSQVVVNVSIDGVGEMHDSIRGVPGSYEKSVRTFKALKGLALPNLSVGIHTVISRFNAPSFRSICDAVKALGPDSFITEIAEERVELGTVGAEIAPTSQEYAEAVGLLCSPSENGELDRIGRMTHAFRVEYYETTKRWMREQKQIVPCYAGFASAHISPDGNVWACCVKAKSLGSLKEVGYDFRKVWSSEKAREERRKIKDGACHCPLANAGYTNMLFSPRALWRVGLNYLGLRRT